MLNDKQVRAYLSSYKNDMGALSDNATKAGIVGGIALVKANPWIGVTAGTYLGLEGLNASHIASLYDDVFTDYTSQSRANGLYVIIQTYNVSPGWGAAVSYSGYNVQFYTPQGSLFKQINYSEH